MNCAACGHQAYAGARACPRCGLAFEEGNSGPATAFDRATRTRRSLAEKPAADVAEMFDGRTHLRARVDPPAAVPPSDDVLGSVTEVLHVDVPVQERPALISGAPETAEPVVPLPTPPPVPRSTPAPLISLSGVPTEVAVAAGAVFLLGAVLLYPLLRYGLPLLPDLFGGGLSGAFASLILSLFVLVGVYGVALCVTAVHLLRGDPVARLLAWLFLAAMALGCLGVGLPGGSGVGTRSALSVILGLAALAVAALLGWSPAVRTFFARPTTEPLGVAVAAAVVTYIGIDVIAAGLLLLPVAQAEARYAAYGALLVGGGAYLLSAGRALRRGNVLARAVVSVVFVAYAALCLVIENGTVSATAVIASAVAVAVVAALWLEPATAALFRGVGPASAAGTTVGDA